MRCGGCTFVTIDLLDLHTHMLEHAEGGNYFYHHATRTAFPKHDYINCEVQTDILAEEIDTAAGSRDKVAETNADDPWGMDENTSDVSFIKSEYRPDKDTTGTTTTEFKQDLKDLIVKTEPENEDDDDNDDDVSQLDTEQVKAAIGKLKEKRGNQVITSVILKGKRKRSKPSRLIVEHQQILQMLGAGMQEPEPEEPEFDEEEDNAGDDDADADYNEETEEDVPKKKRKTKAPVKKKKKVIKVKKAAPSKKDNKKENKKEPKKEPKKVKKDGSSEDMRLRRVWRADTSNKVKQTESMDIVFYCPNCPQSYMRRNRLFHHIETEHAGEYKMHCEKCMIPFIYQSDFEKHQKVCQASEVKTHVCPLCMPKLRLFLTRARIEQHIRNDHSNQIAMKCEKCDAKIVSEFDKRVHQASTHDKSLLKCKICGNGHKSIYRLECHMPEHNRDFPFTCYICEKQMNSEYALWEHVEAHIESMMRFCETCGMNYCKTHNCQVSLSGAVECKVCGKVLACKKSMEKHMDVHEKNYRYHCDQCGEKFIYQKYFLVHLSRDHGQGKTYKCTRCDKIFYLRSSLTRHEKTHDKIRPHVCQFCGFSFSTTWNLKAHIRQHTGEKPYQCSKCGQMFTHNVVRKSHETNCMTGNAPAPKVTSQANKTQPSPAVPAQPKQNPNPNPPLPSLTTESNIVSVAMNAAKVYPPNHVDQRLTPTSDPNLTTMHPPIAHANHNLNPRLTPANDTMQPQQQHMDQQQQHQAPDPRLTPTNDNMHPRVSQPNQALDMYTSMMMSHYDKPPNEQPPQFPMPPNQIMNHYNMPATLQENYYHQMHNVFQRKF